MIEYDIILFGISEGIEFQPKPNEIVFSCPPPVDLSVSGTEDYGNWGSMSWCYPQPRVLTRVSVIPIPLHLADKPDEPQGVANIEEVNGPKFNITIIYS